MEKAGYMLTSTIIAALAYYQANVQDLTNIADRYGYPTAMLALALLVIWYLQKKSDKDKEKADKVRADEKALADAERNALIERNNRLTTQLIEEVKAGNQCKYVK